MKRTRVSIVAVLLLPLAALAADAEETQKADGKQGEAAETQTEPAKEEKPRGDGCVYSRLVGDFEVIDNRTLVIYAPTRKSPYIVELFAPEPSLKFEHTLGFEDRNGDGRICGYGGDSIIVEGPISNRITISSLTRVDPEQVKQLRVAAQEKKPHPGATMPPQEDMKSDKAGAQPAPKPADEQTQPPAEPRK